MGAAIQGLRGSGEFTADYRPKNYRELYTLLEPNGTAPLNALLSMAQSEATDDPEYKNFRDEMPNRVVTINNAGGYNSSATSLTIAAGNDNKYAIAGAILVNSRTGEVVRVTSDTTSTTLAVVRNIGSTAYTINQSDTFFVSGYAATENDTTPTTVSFDADVVSNYTQIFRTAFGLSNTLKSTYLRTGPKEDELTTKALKLHMSDIERAMFFGIKAEENGSSSTPRRYTGGLMTSISTTINLASAVDSDGTMSETQFDDQLIQTVFKYGSKEKLVFGGWKAAALLQQIGKARWQPHQVGGTYGVSVNYGNVAPQKGYGTMTVSFGSAPDRVDTLQKAVLDEVARLQNQGPTADDIQKLQELERRDLETSQRQNQYWMGSLQTVHMFGWDPTSVAHRVDRTNSLSVANVHEALKKYLPLDRYVVVTLKPE